MKLYYSAGSCSLAVRIVINEIGMECEYEAVSLRDKKTETGADFLKINPKGSVPALLTNDGQLLTENSVIQQYLADLSNNTSLLPATNDFKRYRVLEWLNYVSTELHKTCSPLFNPNVSQNDKENVFIPLLKTKISLVDNHLKNNRFLMGEQYTLPDGYLFVVMNWIRHFNLDINHWANIARHSQDMRKRESVKVSLKEEAKEGSST